MDTREKIKKSEELPALLSSGSWVVVVGYFDPLTLDQAQRLRDVSSKGKQLLAVVISKESSLLSARARAELLAALADVDAVLIPEAEEWRKSVEGRAAITVIDDTAADSKRTEAFIQFVVARQRSASPANESQN